jgi:hypothetical protein
VELVERLPTVQEYVGGTGRAIVTRPEALAVARRLGTRVDLVAEPDVVSFYRRLGYEPLHSELMRKAL